MKTDFAALVSDLIFWFGVFFGRRFLIGTCFER